MAPGGGSGCSDDSHPCIVQWERVRCAFVRIRLGFPLADVRPYLDIATHRVDSPSWRLLRDGDFVSGFGGAVEWNRGGRAIPADRRFCTATHAVRLASDLGRMEFGIQPETLRSFRCAGRKLIATPTTTMFRHEIVFERWRPFPPRSVHPSPLSAPALRALVKSFLELPVVVGKRDGRPGQFKSPDGRQLPLDTTLARMRPALASTFLHATTQSAARSSLQSPRWWVASPSTIVVAEYQAGEVQELPQAEHLDLAASDGISVDYYREPAPLHAHVILVGRGAPATDHAELRLIEQLIAHAHTETDTVAHVLRLMETGRIGRTPTTQSGELSLNYLDRAERALKQPRRFSLKQTSLLAVLYAKLGWADEEAQNTLFDELDQARADLGSRLRNLHSALLAEAATHGVVIENMEGDLVMEKQTIKAHNIGVVGDNAKVGAVGDDARTIWNENQSEIPLPELADELARLVSILEEQSRSPEETQAASAVAQAQEAAARGDGPRVIHFLKRAGSWALEVAKTTGVEIAVRALKAAVGLP